jgi:type III pantothenate kinase
VTQLLLDVGNSRLKWALLRRDYTRGQRLASQGVVELGSLKRSAAAWAQLLERLGTRAGTRAGAVGAIHVCNVAGPEVERQIRAAAVRAGLSTPRFARSRMAEGGVSNGYREAWRLGVDRWVALIGAHYEHPGKDLCLVGLGTAMTVDLLDATGRHHGGCLLPGPRLMVESLLEHTAGIRRRAGGRAAAPGFDLAFGAATRARDVGLYAHDTHAALVAGARQACASLIGEALRAARLQLGRRPRLLLSGGAAAAITPLLPGRYWRQDDLILRGLAVLAATPKSPDRIKSRRA